MQPNMSTGMASGGASPAPSAGVPPGVLGGLGQLFQQQHKPVQGGRFDFDDGGMYCGGWEDGKAHGHGVCTGLKGQGEYSGSWNYGFEVSGVYTWPGGSTYEGHWQNGKRHGLGVESRGRWIYRGEWTQGFKGRYGVRQSLTSTAKYDGTWANGLQDGYGSETYADGGTYQGQWLRGLRHGYGVRTSAPFGMASRFRPKTSQGIRSSMTSLKGDQPQSGGGASDPAADRDKRLDDGRGGFVLKARSDEPPVRRRSFSERSSTIKKSLFQGLRLKKQHSTGELEKRGMSASIRSTGSSASWMSTESSQSGMTAASHHTDSNASFVAEDEPLDASVTETYMGEWKNDKRAGFGVSERSDGLKYEGEWFNNKKYGYGVTTFKDGTKEEGKYKNNVLITSQKKKHLFLIRSAKFRERIEAAVSAAQRASKIALQKADIAISRTSTARGKAELADVAAVHAREDADFARIIAKQLAPDFQPSSETLRPPLAALSRLAAPPSGTAAANKYLTPNNVQPSQLQPHDPYATPGGDGSSPSLIEDYSSYSLSVPPGGGGGGGELIRRPSVAIGGVRSPNMPGTNTKLTEPDMSVTNNALPFSYNANNNNNNNSRPGGSSNLNPLIPQSSYVSNNINNNNTSGPGTPAGIPMSPSRQNSLTGAGFGQNLQHLVSSGYGGQQAGYGGQQAGYMDSGDEMSMRDTSVTGHGQLERGRSSLRRGPTLSGGGGSNYAEVNSPSYNFQQAMNDHFDHYKRPPSRDRSRDPSMDRFSRSSRQSSIARMIRQDSGVGGVIGSSRGPSPVPTPLMSNQQHGMLRSTSRQRTGPLLGGGNNSPALASGRTKLDNSSIMGGNEASSTFSSSSSTSGSLLRIGTPMREMSTGPGNGSIPSMGLGQPTPTNSVEEMLFRQRLGQEIPHDYGNTPKRTESLYISPARKKEKAVPAPVPKRKKSLPGGSDPPVPILSREEASVLSSQRREEVRRQAEEAARYRANPLLYFCSPQVKGWFVRHQLTIFILLFNVSLGYIFYKLLT